MAYVEAQVASSTSVTLIRPYQTNTARPFDSSTHHFLDKFRIINIPSIGNVSKARNEGARLAGTQWILFADEDCEIEPETIQLALVEAQSKSNAAPIIWGALYKRQETGPVLARSYNWIQRSWVKLSTLNLEVENLLGGFLLLEKEKFIELDGFNEAIPWAGEETHFLRKASDAGFKLSLLSGIEIEHRNQVSFLGFVRRAWMQGLSKGKHSLSMRTPKVERITRNSMRLDRPSVAELPFILLFLSIMTVGSLVGKWLKN